MIDVNLKILSIAILFFLCQGCADSKLDNSVDKSKAPNILFLFTDDQTYDAVHALGNDHIVTPNFDKIFNRGTTFTHAYNMGGWNGAICAASRAMMISGRSIWHTNEFRQKWIKNDPIALSQTWSRQLQSAGYTTYMTGKWHVDIPPDSIFNHVGTERAGMPDDLWNFREVNELLKEGEDEASVMAAYDFPVGYNRPLNENDHSWSPIDSSFEGFWEGGKHWSEVVKDETVGFLEHATTEDNPFFMYIAFNAPHDPRQAPQEYLDLYPMDEMTVPDNWLDTYPYKYDMGNGPSLRDEALAPFPRTAYAIKKHRQEYYALISHLDTQIGLILDALKDSGKEENTYIFLTSDHGLAVGAHGFIGKQNMYDHSIRTPLVIAGPDIPKGKKIEADVYIQDLNPTALEIAGIKKPDYAEFHSLLDLAKGASNEGHYNGIYGAYIDYQRMIRKDNYKMIYYPKIDKFRLYDLSSDPLEMTDISTLPEHQERLESLKKDLILMAEKIDDPMDLKMEFGI